MGMIHGCACRVSSVSTLRARVDEALDRWRAPALLAGLLALVTLVLTPRGSGWWWPERWSVLPPPYR